MAMVVHVEIKYFIDQHGGVFTMNQSGELEPYCEIDPDYIPSQIKDKKE